MTFTTRLWISLFLSGFVLLFFSCQTWYMPVNSFKKQFSGFDGYFRREVATQGPMGGIVQYKTYPIDSIDVFDKKGNAVTIPNGPAIEIRFTDTANQKTIFYLDLIEFDGELIIGKPSRLASPLNKKISISAIKKIEVQNGRKRFQYVNRYFGGNACLIPAVFY